MKWMDLNSILHKNKYMIAFIPHRHCQEWAIAKLQMFTRSQSPKTSSTSRVDKWVVVDNSEDW
jgi:hypothetical protein